MIHESAITIAIIGSRGYRNQDRIRAYIARIARKHPRAVIVTGAHYPRDSDKPRDRMAITATIGVDLIACEAARAVGLRTVLVPADWEAPGMARAAGLYRNAIIVQLAKHAVAFWDLNSRGTVQGMTLAHDAGKLSAIHYGNSATFPTTWHDFVCHPMGSWSIQTPEGRARPFTAGLTIGGDLSPKVIESAPILAACGLEVGLTPGQALARIQINGFELARCGQIGLIP